MVNKVGGDGMKIERTKNASRNIVFGTLLKLYQVIGPFLMRTAMIYLMGVQYLGLNSLFTSILQVLNLAELGVGSAMIYSMYKPIADDNKTMICALMKLYRTYYRVIGLVIALVGGFLTPFIPRLISGEVPNGINIYVLYLLSLGATVLSYWLFAYKNSILQAFQRTDIVSKVSLFTITVQYGLQLLILVVFKNYYLYVLVMLITQALTNIITAIVADRMYPEYKPQGNVDKKQIKRINQRIKDLFTSKIGSVIYDSADTIVISSFLGLTVLAVYQNYFYILNAITGFITIIFNSCTAGIGNSLVVETKEKNFKDLKKFSFIICWIAGICTVCLLCLYQPFMELWVGKELMLSFYAVICFSIYFFIRQLNGLLNLYKDASGMWHEDRYRPLIAALTNLILNIILVRIIGIYGILLSTVIAVLIVGIPWLLHNLFTYVFERDCLALYLKKIVGYVVVITISCVVTYYICSQIVLPIILNLVVRAIICCILPNFIYYMVYHNCDEFQQAVMLLKKLKK